MDAKLATLDLRELTLLLRRLDTEGRLSLCDLPPRLGAVPFPPLARLRGVYGLSTMPDDPLPSAGKYPPMVGAELDAERRPAGVLDGVLMEEPVFRFRRPSSNHMRKVLRIDARFRGFDSSLVMSGLAARPPSVIDLRGTGAAKSAEWFLTCPG